MEMGNVFERWTGVQDGEHDCVVQCHNEIACVYVDTKINGILVSEIERQENKKKNADVQWYVSLIELYG